ncbi:hypothetical protein BATR1942_17780 [Bacillus atrophaeus 1942]|uniref:Uncharacterized protein n=1 Tax=Bacillus atrophaeus (strain 1942) TaxID=720555 RepID=A0ABN3ZHX8_BACA1|nr:hypothetical protein BATR1942_17780 [Bacillus atrophaeus 1942]EIM11485.1 hypothetical protein UY9_07035 [Bacillus atrophaeus C89]
MRKMSVYSFRQKARRLHLMAFILIIPSKLTEQPGEKY